MTDLLTFIEATKGTSLKIEVTSKGLLEFADALVERAAAKARSEIERESNVEYVPKKEAIDLLGVCDATLWHWARSGYLAPVMPDSIGHLLNSLNSSKMSHVRNVKSTHACSCVSVCTCLRICAFAYSHINTFACLHTNMLLCPYKDMRQNSSYSSSKCIASRHQIVSHNRLAFRRALVQIARCVYVSRTRDDLIAYRGM